MTDDLDPEKPVLTSPWANLRKSIYDNDQDSDDEPLALIRSLAVERDSEGIICEWTLIGIFDKWNSIRGIWRKAKEFWNKWR